VVTATFLELDPKRAVTARADGITAGQRPRVLPEVSMVAD
jgi:hypothetical protein